MLAWLVYSERFDLEAPKITLFLALFRLIGLLDVSSLSRSQHWGRHEVAMGPTILGGVSET